MSSSDDYERQTWLTMMDASWVIGRPSYWDSTSNSNNGSY